MESLPLIDLRTAPSDVAGAIGACRAHGFFYIVNHGIDESLGQRLEALSHRFFALPESIKARYAMPLGGRAWRGWFPLGGELTSGRPDWKEGLYLGTELGDDHPRVAAGVPMHGPNLLPGDDVLPGFRQTILDWMREVSVLGHRVMQRIARSLHLPVDYFARRYSADPLILFRIFNYPGRPIPARLVPSELGGFAKIFSSVPATKVLAPPGPHTTGTYGAYAALAVGSALALFLYPHSMTGILSANSGHAIRGNAALLPGYSLMLGMLALLGFFALAGGLDKLPVRAWLQGVRQQLRGAGAVPAPLSVVVRRRRLRRDRHRRARAFGDHVDRRRQPLHAQHPPRVRQPQRQRRAGVADRQVGVADRQVWRARVHPVRADAVRDPAAATRRHLDHSDPAGGDARRLHALVRRLGPDDRLDRGHDRRHLDGRGRAPHADVPARDRRLDLPWLQRALHGDPKPRDRDRADAPVPLDEGRAEAADETVEADYHAAPRAA